MSGPKTSFFAQSQPGGIFIVSDASKVPGNMWFVDSTHANASDSTGAGQNPDLPFATVLFAIAQSAAGDTIYLMPGHAETLEDDDELILSKAGQNIIGLGVGSLRPTFTLGIATDASIVVTAPNCLIENIIIVSAFADVATGIDASATADGLEVRNCELRDGGAALELVIGITIAVACDRCYIHDNVFSTVLAGGCASAIKLIGESVGTRIENNTIQGDYSVAGLDGATAAATQLIIKNNTIINADGAAGLAISLNASTTGVVSKNALAGDLANTTPLAAAGCYAIENYCTDSKTESGLLSPTATDFA